ncbi:DUF1742-domain-containing protein [Jaminaea rosea]|uniref:DUF1742-domain-containing protein n=1 Tax=Jaminaea rosea TaxID=1569628 RepID=A0A316V011_9BASI|nr:DUF1742-domain-containing protein [Jaminaea rosea]PWN30574.1 DUF1742-domain-containing protein [Jaminaea rosea]
MPRPSGTTPAGPLPAPPASFAAQPPPPPLAPPALASHTTSSATPAPAHTAPRAAGPPPPRLTNHYIRRLVAEPGKACFVCSRPTPVVLVSTTAGADDFFYACRSHLSDRHFATLTAGPGSSGSAAAINTASDAGRLPDKVSKEEIDKIKKEYEEKQKAKEAKKKEEGDKAEGKDKDKDKDQKDDKSQQGWLSYLATSLKDATISSPSSQTTEADRLVSARTASASVEPSSSQSQPKGHEYYTLHRSFYAMRVDLNDRKQATRRAKELNFPSVPRA